PRRARGRPPVAAPGPSAPPSADTRRDETAAPAGEPGPAALAGVRGPALDRCRDPGVPGRRGGELAHRAPAASRELPTRVPARLGRSDLLPAAPPRSP